MSTKSNYHDVVVIGAGMSGLACASRLQDHFSGSGKTVLVVEARDRIGGRVATETVHGCRLDTGANWIHGIGTDDNPNPLVKILPNKRIRTLRGTVAFQAPPQPKEAVRDGSWEIVPTVSNPRQDAAQSKSDLVMPPETAGVLMGTVWQLFDELHQVATSTPAEAAKKTTMVKAIAESETFRGAFERIDEAYHENLKALPQFIESMEAAPLVAQSAEGPDDAPGLGLLEFALDDFDGEQVFVQDGYLSVIEEVAKGLVKAGSIKLSAEVTKIEWDSKPIVISLKDGRTIEAGNVVTTIPLGVLKAKHETVFHPALPKAKEEAIKSLGFGTLDKIFIVYDKAWWTDEPYSSILAKGLVQDPEDDEEVETPDTIMGFSHSLPGVSISPDGSTATSARTLLLANLHALTGFPVLSCFVSCANARDIESHSDSYAENLLHDSLTAWFGREPPRPAGVHVTRWAQDEFSRGSYSHMIVGVSETKHREEFSKPEASGRLGFAGECTSLNHFATVHGALISGWREADRIWGQD